MSKSVTKKLKTTTFKGFLIAVIIVVISFLVYVHDMEWNGVNVFKGMKGFSGFSSLRVGVWAVGLFVFALTGWLFAFANANGKRYRFVMLVPIFMAAYQLAVYLLDARKTTTNEFNFKVVLNFALVVILVVVYFYGRKKSGNDG